MKNSSKQQLQLSISREHQKYQSDVIDAFKDFDVSFGGEVMRFSGMEMPMQIIAFIGGWAASSIAWDLLKSGIKHLYKKFANARVTLRDADSIMYTVRPDLTVVVLAVPDKSREFKDIITIDDLEIYFQNKPKNNSTKGWRMLPVGDVFDFVKSYAFSRDNLVNDTSNDEGIGNVHYGDIHAKFSTPSIDIRDISVPMIRNSSFTPDSEDFLKDGDLIMADASEDYEGVGVTVSVHGIGNKKIVGGLHTFVLRDDNKNTNDYYRQYIFRNPKVRNSLQKIANGVSVYGISKSAVSKLLLPIPPLPEQSRIVAVLETWDKAIEKLTRKIEIKKANNRSLMQKLLMGKTRLSGFKEKWGKVPIGSFSSLFMSLNIDDHKYEVLSCTKYDGLVLSLEYFDRKVYGNDLTKYKVVPRLHFAYATNHIEEGSIGYQNFIDFGLVSPMYTVFKTKNVNNDFLFKLLKAPRSVFEYQRQMTASVERRGGLRWKAFSKIELNLPPKTEQDSIAKFIETSEKEIGGFEYKLSLLKDQKKYLLNNLITGAIRTPENMKIIKLTC